MRYRYENLSPDQFEDLVVLLGQQLLGTGVQGFATGPDGGRDARFHGTADLYPSRNGPWTGQVILQAKHCNGFNKSFSDPDFSGPQASSVLSKEMPRIVALRKDGELDRYMLFSNRSLTANADQKIRARISDEAEIDIASIAIFGVRNIDSYLKTFSHIERAANLDPMQAPLMFSSEDLAEVVEALTALEDLALDDFRIPPPIRRISYEEKNRLNDLSAEYAKAWRRSNLKHVEKIEGFLANPANLRLKELYESATEDLRLKIISHRSDHASFDRLVNYINDYLFQREPILARNRRLTSAVIFFMYWACDIGREESML